MADAGKCCEGIALAGVVTLGLEECGNEVWRIWNERLGVLIDGCNGEDGVLADVCVTVL